MYLIVSPSYQEQRPGRDMIIVAVAVCSLLTAVRSATTMFVSGRLLWVPSCSYIGVRGANGGLSIVARAGLDSSSSPDRHVSEAMYAL